MGGILSYTNFGDKLFLVQVQWVLHQSYLAPCLDNIAVLLEHIFCWYIIPLLIYTYLWISFKGGYHNFSET